MAVSSVSLSLPIYLIVIGHLPAQLLYLLYRLLLPPRLLHLHANPTHPDARQKHDEEKRPQTELIPTEAGFAGLVHTRSLAEFAAGCQPFPILPTRKPPSAASIPSAPILTVNRPAPADARTGRLWAFPAES